MRQFKVALQENFCSYSYQTLATCAVNIYYQINAPKIMLFSFLAFLLVAATLNPACGVTQGVVNASVNPNCAVTQGVVSASAWSLTFITLIVTVVFLLSELENLSSLCI